MGGSIGILHLGKYYPPEPGGMEYVVKSLAEATRSEINNYCLVAAKSGETRVEVPAEGITVHYLRELGTLLLTPVLPTLPFVLHRLRVTRRPSVILLHYPNPMAIVAVFLSLLLQPKREVLVMWHHADVIFEERWKRFLYTLFRPIEEFVFRRADAFVAATPHHVRESAILRRFKDRVFTIPFAVSDAWFDVSPEEEAAGAKVRARFGGRFLLFVGRFVPYKGLDTLLSAAGFIDARIVLVGSGPMEGYLRREIVAKGLEEKVHLSGNVEDLRPWYLGCEFLVLPSNSALEAFGIVQIEAMALGKPVVSSDLPTGVTYVNRNGETGFTFPVGDASAFAAACSRLLGDEALRTRLGRQARERARVEFSYTALSGKAVSFFRSLAGENEKAPMEFKEK